MTGRVCPARVTWPLVGDIGTVSMFSWKPLLFPTRVGASLGVSPEWVTGTRAPHAGGKALLELQSLARRGSTHGCPFPLSRH